MQKIDQKDPYDNRIITLILHAWLMPVEEKMAKAKAELVQMVWDDPLRVERVAFAYARQLASIRGMRLDFYEKTDGRQPDRVLSEEQERRLLMLVREIKAEARAARMCKVKDRDELSWARRHSRETGARVSIRVH
ncbi:MAG TPA: hypothetical protein PKJ97_03060 [Candidatus Bilamarchaeaceae archaeon]|nr:hypothetical protein [Candidatus Bilamarchaeaceae archaeon]